MKEDRRTHGRAHHEAVPHDGGEQARVTRGRRPAHSGTTGSGWRSDRSIRDDEWERNELLTAFMSLTPLRERPSPP